MTTLAPNTDRIVTLDVPAFPRIADIVTMIADKLRRSVQTAASPEVVTLITVPGVRANGRDWLIQALNRLESAAALPSGWDGEGAPPPDPQIVTSAARVLQYLQRDDVPVPFICPIAGGGIQIEWSSPERHIELELVDHQTVAFLQAENTTTGETIESGEYPVSDVRRSRELLDWLASA
jgi:hypothetical protein